MSDFLTQQFWRIEMPILTRRAALMAERVAGPSASAELVA